MIAACYNVGIKGQKGSRGEKGDRGLPGTCTQQMVDRMNLTSDLRIRSRGDRRSDRSNGRGEEEEGVKNMLTTLFETCVDDVLSGDEEESSISAFGNRSEQSGNYLVTKLTHSFIIIINTFHSFYC